MTPIPFLAFVIASLTCLRKFKGGISLKRKHDNQQETCSQIGTYVGLLIFLIQITLTIVSGMVILGNQTSSDQKTNGNSLLP